MGKKETDFRKRLLATFAVEATEHVQAMSSGLIDLEKTPLPERQAEIVEVVFREAHSLKGAARSVSFVEIETVCQTLENVLSALKRQEIAVTPLLLDRLHQAVDGVTQLLAPGATPATLNFSSLLRELEGLVGLAGRPVAEIKPPLTPEPPPLPVPPVSTAASGRGPVEEAASAAETIRIATARLDSLLLQTEELLSAKLAADQHAIELESMAARLSTWRKQWAKAQPAARALARSLATDTNGNEEKAKTNAAQMLDYMSWNKDMVDAMERQLTAMIRTAQRDRHTLGRMVDDLLHDMKQASMLPFSSALEVFPKLLRDLARDNGKDVALVVQGADIEVDRRVLQALKDPLIHLIRNSVDHGIETPEARARQQKPPRGTITIAVEQKDGGKIEVLVSDDGAGIDAASVRSATVKLGLVSDAAAHDLTDSETFGMIFQSGVSTTQIITDISGRGLGLAIVQEKVEKLGGTVSVETRPGLGTTFRLLLPVALATYRGVLISVSGHLFVLPAANVEQVIWMKTDDIQTVENREAIRFNGVPVSLVRLADVLKLNSKGAAVELQRKVPVVVVNRLDKRLAFQVDKVLGEQEVLVKGLGPQLVRLRNIAGVTVLGTGQVVPTLNVADLMKSAVNAAGAPVRVATAAPGVPRAAKRKFILVAEDSITARTLLKSILEGAGYDVQTAVDGQDALTALKTLAVDLVVSDVEMPRLSGLDLTEKIRADSKLADLPVILVTALESRQDRERGIEVGANAYLVKSSFDQSNLLEVIARLI